MVNKQLRMALLKNNIMNKVQYSDDRWKWVTTKSQRLIRKKAEYSRSFIPFYLTHTHTHTACCCCSCSSGRFECRTLLFPIADGPTPASQPASEPVSRLAGQLRRKFAKLAACSMEISLVSSLLISTQSRQINLSSVRAHWCARGYSVVFGLPVTELPKVSSQDSTIGRARRISTPFIVEIASNGGSGAGRGTKGGRNRHLLEPQLVFQFLSRRLPFYIFLFLLSSPTPSSSSASYSLRASNGNQNSHRLSKLLK